MSKSFSDFGIDIPPGRSGEVATTVRIRDKKGVFKNDPAREVAKAKGEKHYMGHDCPEKHGGLRFVSNYGCVECLREHNKAYYYKNQEEQKERLRRYAKNHVEINRAGTRNYNARKKLATGTHSAQDIQSLLITQKGKCYWCGTKVKKYHVDHIIPLKRGGKNTKGNLCISCVTCNLSKGAKMPHEWKGVLF